MLNSSPTGVAEGARPAKQILAAEDALSELFASVFAAQISH